MNLPIWWIERRRIHVEFDRASRCPAIITRIETKDNRRRRRQAPGKLTPTAFEMIYTAADAA